MILKTFSFYRIKASKKKLDSLKNAKTASMESLDGVFQLVNDSFVCRGAGVDFSLSEVALMGANITRISRKTYLEGGA